MPFLVGDPITPQEPLKPGAVEEIGQALRELSLLQTTP